MSTGSFVVLLMFVAGCCQYCPDTSYFMQDTKRAWCTWLTPGRDTLQKTRRWCAENGGGLILTIEDEGVQDYFEINVAPSLRMKNISKVWINYNLASHTTFEGINLTYRKNTLYQIHACVTIDTANGYWQVMPCLEMVHGLCYKVIMCPSGAFLDTENELCFWLTNKTQVAETGQQQCLNENGTLGVVPISLSQLSLASNLRQRHMLDFIPHNEMWIGVTDACYEGEFYKWTGETLPPFTNWSLQQLAHSNTQPNEDCAVINVEKDDIELFARDCNETRVSLCSRRFAGVYEAYNKVLSAKIVCPEKTTPSKQEQTTSTEPATTTKPTSTMNSNFTTLTLTSTVSANFTKLKLTTAVQTNKPMIATAAATSPNHHDVCRCHKYVTHLASTAAIVERLENLRTNTFINKKKTTAHKRRLVSADDSRPSSRNIGVAATIVMASVLVLIILPDVNNCVLAIWKFIRSGTTLRNKVPSV